MMPPTRRPQSPKLPVPKTSAEVNEYITRVSEAKVSIQRLNATATKRLQAIQSDLAENLSPLEDELKQLATALYTYFEQHREELTDGGKRQSTAFATGVLGQRLTPLRTQIEDEEAVKTFVQDRRMGEFYEEKIVLRRDVMLANQSLAGDIPGVSFVRDRIIFVQPNGFEAAIDLKKKIETT